MSSQQAGKQASQVIQSSSQFESVLAHGSHLQPSLYCVPSSPKLAKTDPEPKLGWCSASGPLSNAYADTREKGSHKPALLLLTTTLESVY